jgi:hypothetical protein
LDSYKYHRRARRPRLSHGSLDRQPNDHLGRSCFRPHLFEQRQQILRGCTESDTDAYGDTNSNRNRNSNSYSASESDPNSNCDIYCHACRDTDGDAYRYSYRDANTYSHTNADPNTYTDTDANPKSDPGVAGHQPLDSHAGSDRR